MNMRSQKNKTFDTSNNNVVNNSLTESDYYFLASNNLKTFLNEGYSNFTKKDFQVDTIRKDFPILNRRIHGRPLIWLDNAATTQKPLCVIDSLKKYYSEYNSNIHRGSHTLSQIATNEYEKSREKIKNFIGASSNEEIIFVSGTTEAINLVSESYGSNFFRQGDEIIITTMEHHSNIVPWQKLKSSKGINLKVVPINENGEIIIEEYAKLFSPLTKFVTISHISNVLGTINPIKEMIDISHKNGVPVLIDGAQSIPHLKINVTDLDADFFAFSGHKIYGPTGIGVLYGKKNLLEKMPPWKTGGGMIKDVTIDKTIFNSLPYKFEAGTVNIADAIALSSAIDYIESIGIDNIENHERNLTIHTMTKLSEISGLQFIGRASNKTSVISFIIDGVDSNSAAKYLNGEGIAVRSGHHCAQPTLHRYGLKTCIRVSIGMYNTYEEIDSMVNIIQNFSTHAN